MFNFSYAVQFPLADMAKRFGVNSNIGGSFLVKTKKNILLGADGRFIFSNNLNDTAVLSGIETELGQIINENGVYANVLMTQRGLTFSGKIGKIFPVFGPNKNSGIMAQLGAGILQHKIRIEVQGNTVPQLEGDYVKGYDRLSNGLMLYQFLGYQHFSNSRLLNFYIGFEAIEGFIKNRRSYDFQLMKKLEESRTDILVGVRLGWSIPLYKKTAREFYYD